MTMEKKYEVLADLFKDEKMAEKLLSLSPADATKYLSENYQLDFTTDELESVAQGIKKALEEGNEEVTEGDLEAVVGGANSIPYNVGYYIGKGVKVVATVGKTIASIISSGW